MAEKAINDAKAARIFYLDKVKKCANKLTQNFEEISDFELKQNSDKMKGLFDKFEEKCMALKCLDSSGATNDEDDEIEALCDSINSKVERKLLQSKETNVPNISESQNLAQSQPNPVQNLSNPAEVNKIDQIENIWGQFDGSLVTWHRFHQKFKAEIHDNASLKPSEKMQLLKNACIKKASRIVLSANNDYQNAWDQLNEIYGNKYTQLHYTLHRVSAIKPIDEPTSSQIETLMQQAKQCKAILDAIMKPEEYDAIFTVLFSNKLDEQTTLAWDRHRQALAQSWAMAKNVADEKVVPAMHMPKWQDLVDFLQSESRIMFIDENRRDMQRNLSQSTDNASVAAHDNASNSRQYTQNMPSSGNATSSTNVAQNNLHKNVMQVHSQQACYAEKANAPLWKQCTLCDDIHGRYGCPVFQAMGYTQKWAHVQQEGLCVKCLRHYHEPRPCENKLSNENCPLCYQQGVITYHNSQLCPVRYNLPACDCN